MLPPGFLERLRRNEHDDGDSVSFSGNQSGAHANTSLGPPMVGYNSRGQVQI